MWRAHSHFHTTTSNFALFLYCTQTTHIMAPDKTMVRTDVILPMTVSLVFLPASCAPQVDMPQDDYMQQIIRGEKNYEFRRYLISPSVQRVWFYLNAPLSQI